MRTLTLAALVASVSVTFSGAHAPSGADRGETIYARTYSGGRRLVVLKNEIPLSKAYPDGMPVTMPSPRNPAIVATVTYAAHVYEYPFIVQSPDGKSQMVAKARCATFRGDVERMQFEIYDVALYEDELVVLLRRGRTVAADIALLGAGGSGFLMQDAPWLAANNWESGTWPLGGRIERSPETGEVSVVVVMHERDGDSTNRRFKLRIKEGRVHGRR